MLVRHCQSYGRILTGRVIEQHQKNIGFIRFECYESAAKAISELNNTAFFEGAERIQVRFAKVKPRVILPVAFRSEAAQRSMSLYVPPVPIVVCDCVPGALGYWCVSRSFFY